MDNKSECRGKWFLIIIGTCFRVCQVSLFCLFVSRQPNHKCRHEALASVD